MTRYRFVGWLATWGIGIGLMAIGCAFGIIMQIKTDSVWMYLLGWALYFLFCFLGIAWLVYTVDR